MRLIAFITHSADIRQILEHIGVDCEPPHITPARVLHPAQNATNEPTLLQVEQSDVSHRAMESAQAARSAGHDWGAPVDIGTNSNAASCDAGGVADVSGRVFTAANPPNPEDRCSSPH